MIVTSDNTSPGIYVHIPFCRSRCGYCDFVSTADMEDGIESYVKALCREIALWEWPADAEFGIRSSEEGIVHKSNLLPHSAIHIPHLVKTIYLGGGTPSILEPRHIFSIFQSLFAHFQITDKPEVNIEANPESVSMEKALAWKKAGINRVSIGLQAYDDDLLRAIGRIHSVKRFVEAFNLLRAAGFENINIDLVYGLPGQTFKGWSETLERTVSFAPEHLSLYALTVEPGTPFAASGVSIDNDLQAEMYDHARTFLEKAGYPQYEISNFARAGRECRHNLIYWRQEPYIGLGAGAVGCVDGMRWENHRTLQDYESAVISGIMPRLSEEALDEKTREFERLMLGLRLREGLAWKDEGNTAWIAERKRLAAAGRLEELRPGIWRIPHKYVPVTNQILLSFF